MKYHVKLRQYIILIMIIFTQDSSFIKTAILPSNMCGSVFKAEICRFSKALVFLKWYLQLQIIMRYRIQNITIGIMNRALLDKTQIYMECRAQELLKDYRECSHLR